MKEDRKNLHFKLAIVSLSILLVGSFWLTIRASSDPVSMAVAPEVPRVGEPVLATFKLSNPSSQPLLTNYRFYANGELLEVGTTTIAPATYEVHQYAYKNPLQIGEQLNFVVRTESKLGNHESVVSSPPYPPQVWSSFVSFASFSTSLMSSMSTMTYYQVAFASSTELNVGLVCTAVLIGLLIFMELTQPVMEARTIAVIGRLRIRLSTVTWILFIILVGIVYTKIVMIIST